MTEPKAGGHLRRFIEEVVTIVVGILLALGANASYQYFVDRASEREILAALRLEFAADNVEIDADQSERAGKVDAIALLLGQQPDAVGRRSPEALAEALDAAIGYRFYTASHPVLDDVLTTGRLDLIRSDALRHALMQFGAARSRLGVVEQLERDFVSTQMQPFMASRLDLATLASRPLDPSSAAVKTAYALLPDPRFRSMLALDDERTKSSQRFSDLLKTRVLEVQAVLDPNGAAAPAGGR